jgi:hypothetical protein
MDVIELSAVRKEQKSAFLWLDGNWVKTDWTVPFRTCVLDDTCFVQSGTVREFTYSSAVYLSGGSISCITHSAMKTTLLFRTLKIGVFC